MVLTPAKILVVDDEPRNLRLLEALLVPHGYELLMAPGGAECLELATDADLILLDAMMPGIDGFEVVRRLRSNVATRAVPVVMITALDSSEDKLRAIDVGCDDFLSKPIDRNEALVRIRTLLRLAHYRRQLDERRKLDAVIAQMSDGSVICDGAWKVLRCNNTAAAYLGLRSNEVTFSIDLLYERYAVSRPREEFESLAYDRRSFELTRAATDRFRELILAMSVEVLRDAAGVVTSVVLTLRDVTAERQQEMLQREFLSLISHKLRTPLTVITLNASLLKEGALGKLPDTARPVVENLVASAEAFGALVDQLIRCASLRRHDREAGNRVLTAKTAIPEVAGAAVRAFTRKPVELNLGIDDVSIPMTATHLTIILENLIENALKFNDKDVVTIDVTVRQSSEGTVLSVADNGPGIPPEERRKVFEKFYQIERYFTGSIQGAGLGLPLVKNLVESYGGHIHLESELGVGSSFTVTLPPGVDSLVPHAHASARSQ